MALNNPTDLFHYELSATYDAENNINQMRSEIAGQVPDDTLSQELSNEQSKGEQKTKNLDARFPALGTSRQDVPCLVIDGMRAEFQQFLKQEPSPQVLAPAGVGAGEPRYTLKRNSTTSPSVIT